MHNQTGPVPLDRSFFGVKMTRLLFPNQTGYLVDDLCISPDIYLLCVGAQKTGLIIITSPGSSYQLFRYHKRQDLCRSLRTSPVFLLYRGHAYKHVIRTPTHTWYLQSLSATPTLTPTHTSKVLTPNWATHERLLRPLGVPTNTK